MIKKVVIDNFGIENARKVFVKPSTGFYKTKEGKPNEATFKAMKMIEIGVARIGTSSSKKIIEGELTEGY